MARSHRWCHEEMPTDHPAGVRSLDLDPGGLALADLDTALGAHALRGFSAVIEAFRVAP